MNANDVIESYVTDVAVQLPRKQRNDVAFELRALIGEGLQDTADAAGRPIDAAMAIEFLRAFGRPADVAARYRPALTIIDPADGHGFLVATVVGLAVIWGLGLLQALQEIADSVHPLTALGYWWGSVVVGSLWWPGMLVVGFGAAAWARRRWPQASEWKPRSGDLMLSNRVGLTMALIGMVCGLLVLKDPRWVLDFFWGGRAAPVAYEAMSYTETFRQRQGPVLLAILALNIPIFFAAIVQGRWSVNLRRIQDASSVALCVASVWTLMDGPVFRAAASDKAAKFALVLTVVFILIDMGVKRYRRVKPAPN